MTLMLPQSARMWPRFLRILLRNGKLSICDLFKMLMYTVFQKSDAKIQITITTAHLKICNVCTRKAIIKAAKRIFNSDKICRSYCDFYFGVTFLEHSVDPSQVLAIMLYST